MSAAYATDPIAPAPADLHATPAAQRRRTQQDRAWDLACQGLRAPAIADALGVPQRTVRAWLASIRREVADELRERHADALLLAVEAVHHVAATAWAAYEREADREIAASTDPKRDRRASQAPRYLTLALAAHVQAARLLGLHRKDVQAAYAAALTALAGDPHDFPTDSQSPAESAEIAAPASADFSPPVPAPAPPRRDPERRTSARSAEIAATDIADVSADVTNPEIAAATAIRNGAPATPRPTQTAGPPTGGFFVAARPRGVDSLAGLPAPRSHARRQPPSTSERQNRQKPRRSRRSFKSATLILKAPTR